MKIKCRCCLGLNKSVYHSLLSDFPGCRKTGSSILEILRIVTSSQIVLTDDLPKEICQGCLKDLKNAFKFITVFRNSQTFLQRPLKPLHIEHANGDNVETIIITQEEYEDVLGQSSQEENIVIITEDEENVETHFEEFFVDNIKPLQCTGKMEIQYLSSEEEAKFIIQPPKGVKKSVKNMDVIKSLEEHLIKEEPREGPSDKEMEYGSKYFDQDFQKDLLEMEKNRERNKKSVTIMTVEDVLKVSKRRASEKKVILTAEDVLNVEKKRRPKGHMTDGVYMCDICKRVFNSKGRLTNHKYRLHNPNWRETFRCSVCLLECKTMSALAHHKLMKHKENRYECHLCGKKYIIKQHLAVHIKMKHRKSFEYLCPLCGKSMRSSAALTYHLLIHNNQRNHMCRYCGFKSVALSAMKRHERVHTGERPFICRYCGRSFAGAAERQKHEDVHNGIRPYKCQYCDKRFGQTYNMKVHLLQHGGDFDCSLCDKSFVDESTLMFHYKRRHKEMLEDDDNLDGE